MLRLSGPRPCCSRRLHVIAAPLVARRCDPAGHDSIVLAQTHSRRRNLSTSAHFADVALVNVDYISPSLWLGVAVAMSGLVLYSFKMQNARGTQELDIVTASLLVLVGGILTLQGWRLDPILMLSEAVLACVGVYYIVQTVELRKQLMDSYDETYDPRQRGAWRDDEYWEEDQARGELPSGDQYAYYRNGQYYDARDQYSNVPGSSQEGMYDGLPHAQYRQESQQNFAGDYYDKTADSGRMGIRVDGSEAVPSSSGQYMVREVSGAQQNGLSGRQAGSVVQEFGRDDEFGGRMNGQYNYQVDQQALYEAVPPSQWPTNAQESGRPSSSRGPRVDEWGEQASSNENERWGRRRQS